MAVTGDGGCRQEAAGHGLPGISRLCQATRVCGSGDNGAKAAAGDVRIVLLVEPVVVAGEAGLAPIRGAPRSQRGSLLLFVPRQLTKGGLGGWLVKG